MTCFSALKAAIKSIIFQNSCLSTQICLLVHLWSTDLVTIFKSAPDKSYRKKYFGLKAAIDKKTHFTPDIFLKNARITQFDR